MKKVLLLLTVALSITSYSQVDPSFTSKFKLVIDAAKAYDSAPEVDKPEKAELMIEAANAFYPITQSGFASKFSSMLNSSAEMAKLPNIVGFIQCLGPVISNFNSCLFYYLNNTTLPPSSQCNPSFVNNVIVCMSQYLVN